jgi:hypothetical protein
MHGNPRSAAPRVHRARIFAQKRPVSPLFMGFTRGFSPKTKGKCGLSPGPRPLDSRLFSPWEPRSPQVPGVSF